jgi:predicted dehydrogenase
MIRLLILGTGSMARTHALAFKAEPECSVVAAVETNPARLAAFAAEHAIANRFTDLDQAIAWGGFDAVANVTPDGAHYPTTMKLLAAGKHVFCEKPLATDHAHAAEMAEAAEARSLVNMVNLTYRNAASLQKARELVAAGAIGDIRHITASYFQSWLTGRHWGDWRTEERWLWRLSTAHGSKGVLGDIGIHIVDFATFAAGSDIASLTSRLGTFPKAPGERIGAYPLDANDSFVLSVMLANGALGTIEATRWGSGYGNDLRLQVFGAEGALDVTTDGKTSRLRICKGADIDTQTWRDVPCPPVRSTYQRFADAVASGVNGDPDFRRAADLQRILDMSFAEDGRGWISLGTG